MEALVSIFIFLAASAVIWFFTGALIESIVKVAARFQRSGFSVAFFILGFLTSISEFSVAMNAWITGTPQVSVGNLAGASFVTLLFIIPFLAVVSKGIELKHSISKSTMALALAVAVLPVALVIDGSVTRYEGLLVLMACLTLAAAVERQGRRDLKQVEEIPEDLLGKKHANWRDLLKIVFGGLAIFVAAHFMVRETIYFAAALSVPSSIMGLLILSIGTNVPELVVAVRSILKRRGDIAFGDYLGSAVANSSIFGLLVLLSGAFEIEAMGFLATLVLMLAGLVCLYFFAQSKDRISRREGLVLVLFYFFFVAAQLGNVVAFWGE